MKIVSVLNAVSEQLKHNHNSICIAASRHQRPRPQETRFSFASGEGDPHAFPCGRSEALRVLRHLLVAVGNGAVGASSFALS